MQAAIRDNSNMTALHTENKVPLTLEGMIEFSFDATLRLTSVTDSFSLALVAQAIQQVADATEKSATATDAISQATNELASGAEQLKVAVQKFAS